MRDASVPWITSLVLFAVAFALHTSGIDRRGLADDEAMLASCATDLARSQLHDQGGRPLPLFVKCSGEVSLPPLPVYASIATLEVWSSQTAALRLVPAVMGAINVVLTYILARHAFGGYAMPLLAAIALALTPSHVRFSRTASLDGVWALPFALLWLTALARFASTSSRSPWPLASAGAALGLMVYAQPSGAVLALLLIVPTSWACYRIGVTRQMLLSALGALLVTLMPAAIWLAVHRSSYAETFGRWLLHPAHVRNPIAWARAVTNWPTLTNESHVFWDFFSPSHLFVDERAPVLTGVFLMPMIVPMLIGARRAIRQPVTDSAHLLTLLAGVGCVIAALVVAIFSERRALQRGLVAAVFGAVLAASGIAELLERRTTASRAVLAAILAGSVMQFAVWYSRAMW